MATEPLVRGAWLRPGTHVDLVGAYQPTMREADDEARAPRAHPRRFRGSTVEEAGDLTQPLASGASRKQTSWATSSTSARAAPRAAERR